MTTNPASKVAVRSVIGRVRVSYPRLLRLLVPLDFSGKSRQALRYAVPLAQKFFGQIVLLHVIETGRRTNPVLDLLTPEETRRRAAAQSRLEQTAARLVPKAVRGRNLVHFGRPADAIVETAGRMDADLIVMTTHGRSGLDRFFLGSTAEQVMRHAGCPVLSVRRH